MAFEMQIDVLNIGTNFVICRLQTGEQDESIIMGKASYENLVRAGFFHRPLDGPPDRTGVLNTTLTYFPDPEHVAVLENSKKQPL